VTVLQAISSASLQMVEFKVEFLLNGDSTKLTDELVEVRIEVSSELMGNNSLLALRLRQMAVPRCSNRHYIRGTEY